MLVRCLAPVTSMSKSTSKKSDWRWCMRMLTMLPPASPIRVQAWPSTPGALRTVAIRRARDTVSSACGVQCRSRQTSSRSSYSASREQSMVCTASPSPEGCRMPTIRSPGTGLQQSAKCRLTPGVSPPPRTYRRAERPSSMRTRAEAATRSLSFKPGNTLSSTWVACTRPRPTCSNSSSSLGWAKRSSAGRSDTPARSRSALAKAWSTAARPSRTNSSRSVRRMWRRMAERARPVRVSERQFAGTAGLWPRITSTTSPLDRGVRSGRSSPLILAPTVVSPTSVCTA